MSTALPNEVPEPGKAKFINAPKDTFINVFAERKKWTAPFASARGTTINLPPLPKVVPDRIVIRADHPDGLQSIEAHYTPSEYELVRKHGSVTRVWWNVAKEHEGAFSNVSTDLGEMVEKITGHRDRMIVDDPALSEDRPGPCPECRGTRIYNCPFKGPVPCSLCGGN